MRKNFYQSFMGSLSPDLRSADMSDWGTPTVDETPQAPATGFRMNAIPWSPGEFDEWKQAKMMHIPTTYGKIMQDRYNRNRHRLPAAPGVVEQENATLAAKYPNAYGGVYGDLLDRFKR